VRVLGITVFGLLFADINFILVAKYYKYLPGGYWFFVVGGIVDGVMGGLTTVSAAIHAYMADSTDPSARSRVFSLFVGLMFSGIAFGPTLGGLIVKHTGNLLTVFYIACAVHILWAMMLWFIIPESVTRAQMVESRRGYTVQLEQAKRDAPGRPFMSRFKILFSFLSPLALLFFAPSSMNGKQSKVQRGAWSLRFVALSYGCTVLLFGGYSYKFQYTSYKFQWTSEEIGYWLSIVGLTRAFFLTLVLPLLIKLFKSKPKHIQLPIEPSEPLQPDSTSSPTPSDATIPVPVRQSNALAFDLGLARASLIVDIVSYSFLPFATNPLLFTAFSMLGCFGAGLSPALQSVAMGLYSQQGGKESGKLFGAMSVVQAISSSIIGPTLFGFVYVKTVRTAPATIFFVSSAALATAFVFLLFVRLPKSTVDDDILDPENPITPAQAAIVREETLVDTSVPEVVVEDEGVPKTART